MSTVAIIAVVIGGVALLSHLHTIGRQLQEIDKSLMLLVSALAERNVRDRIAADPRAQEWNVGE